MSLQLKYKSEFLDLAANQNAEMEKTSPLFLVDNYIQEYSTPIAIVYSDKNARLLGNLFFELTVKTKQKFQVEIYSNGTYRGNGTLVVESAGMNRSFAGKSSLSGYVLTGLSNFFTQIKDKKLTDLVLGGVREFVHTTDDPLDGSNGYWQIFQDSYNFTQDFVVPPCKNNSFTEDDITFAFTDGWMNKFDGEKIKPQQNVVPWPKLEYVLKQIFLEHGWTLDTSDLDGTSWDRMILYSNYIVECCGFAVNTSTGEVGCTPRPTITMELNKAMPPDKLCSTFIFELCKRYFWFPLGNNSTRTCRLLALKNVGSGTVKDWTKYSAAASSSDFTQEQKVFAFKTTIEGDDNYSSSAPDVDQWQQGYTNSFRLLPEPDQFSNFLFYSYLENKWYKTEYNSTAGTNSWVDYGDNIYDEDNDQATDTIETIVSTLPIVEAMFENGFRGFVPIVDQPKKTSWGIRTVLYHGMVKQINNLGQGIDFTYPYASSTHLPPTSKPALPWSNVWKHSNGLQDFGIIEYWGKRWINMIASTEVITRNLYLPLHELINYKWNDVILLHNIPYLIKSYIEPLNYKGFIQATLQKVRMIAYAVPTPPVSGGGAAMFNGQDTISGTDTEWQGIQYVVGPFNATLTIKIVFYTPDSGPLMDKFQFKINNNEMYLNNTFTVTLDANGEASYNVSIHSFLNPPAEHGGMAVRVQIISTDTGNIGSPDTAQYNKVV